MKDDPQSTISVRLQRERETKGLTQYQLADKSGVTYSTITKLESGVSTNPTVGTMVKISDALDIDVGRLLQQRLDFGTSEDKSFRNQKKEGRFTFIDLFAGIGGIRIGFEKQGGKCVFSSEIDRFAVKTYERNFDETPHGDITKIDEKTIHDHDILLAGFPCQPFSIAGVSKKKSLGQEHGFLDKTKGTLFFDIARIVKAKRPGILFLENVKNLVSHDKGKTFKTIIDQLDGLQYSTHHGVFDGGNFVPQHRERTIIVAFNRDYYKGKEKFTFPKLPDRRKKLKEILETEVDEKYTLSDKLWNYLQQYAKKHREKGNGFGYGIADPQGKTRTLSARYFKDGSEILVEQKGKNPRRLTPRECARLQGFPEDFVIPVSDTQAYKQFGNSVVVPLMEYLAEKVVEYI